MANLSKPHESSILVWDVPVRVFHWLLVFCFVGAYLSAESERWRLVHVTLGYTMGGLLAFRVVWGLIGSRYARFTAFVRGPTAVLRYVRSLFSAHPEHHLGHNPAGAAAIVLLLLAGAAVVGSGWAVYNDVGGHWLEDLHEGTSNLMVLLVVVHIAGVVMASWLHRENLVRAMLTGRKWGLSSQAIIRSSWIVAILIVLAAAGFWWQQWAAAPV
jgi:cytochrome b